MAEPSLGLLDNPGYPYYPEDLAVLDAALSDYRAAFQFVLDLIPPDDRRQRDELTAERDRNLSRLITRFDEIARRQSQFVIRHDDKPNL